LEDFEKLENLLENRNDISRYSNYKIMLLLKQKKSKMAVSYFEKIIDDSSVVVLNPFDLFWFLKSINDTLLAGERINLPKITKIINTRLSSIDLNMSGHPMDLILRELALFEFQSGDKSKALKYIRKSKNLFTLENSNISKWLKALMDMHEDYFRGDIKNANQYFNDIDDCEFIKIISMNPNNSLLKTVRFYTPY